MIEAIKKAVETRLPFTNESVLSKVTVKNRTNRLRFDWVTATVPFEKGAMKKEDLSLVAENTLCDWTPIKYHLSDGSVAIAKLHTPIILQPGEERELVIQKGVTETLPFQMGPNFDHYIKTQPHPLWFQAQLADGTTLLATLQLATLESLELIEHGPHHQVFRLHESFFYESNHSVKHALTVTAYFTLYNRTDFGDLVLSFGNQTFERPHSGGISITNLDVIVPKPFLFGVVGLKSTGIGAPTDLGHSWRVNLLRNNAIADGSARVFKMKWGCLEGVTNETWLLDSLISSFEDPLYGVADFQSWKKSKAAGITGVLNDPRFTDLNDAKARVERHSLLAFTPTSTPERNIGHVNLNPPSTGDQGDFSSNLPVFAVQTMHTGSAAPLQEAMLAVHREECRPSYWYKNARRINRNDFPELFFWSGVIHYDPSWNPRYPEWFSRLGRNGFVQGPSYGWGTQDNQHFSNNSIKCVYELTGDPYLKELIQVIQTVAFWNHLCDQRIMATDAERATRLLTDALHCAELDPDHARAIGLIDRLVEKNGRAQRPGIQWSLNQWNTPCIDFVHNDNRVPMSIGEGNETCVGWQTGFHLTWQTQLLKNNLDVANATWVIEQFLNHADKFFTPEGDPITYFRLRDPGHRVTGGISSMWWSGWVSAANALPAHPKSEFILTVVAPKISQDLQLNLDLYWSFNDKWKSF